MDTPAEGCYNNNSDLFCDSQYNITNSSGGVANKDCFPFVVKDGWLLTLQITDLIPIQVIKDVDMVKGKRTLIRVPVLFTSNNSNSTINASLKLIWNTSVVNQTTKILNSSQLFNWDNWYIPNETGSGIQVKTEVNGTYLGFNLSDSRVKVVNVARTRQLNLTYIPLFGPSNFGLTVNKTVEFINRTYPVSDNGILYTTSEGPIAQLSAIGAGAACILLSQVAKNSILYLSTITSKTFERRVIVLPVGWVASSPLGSYANGGTGIYCGSDTVAFEERSRHDAAHEIGHSYGLCDEYNSTVWSQQNNPLPFVTDFCPNGDSNNNEQLDFECVGTGCPTAAIKELIPWNLPPNKTANDLLNFMGVHTENLSWIANDSYNHLLKQFSHNSPEFSNQRLLVSGIVNKSSGEIQFDPFYTLGSGFVDNVSEFTGGNYTIETLDNLSNILINLSFNLTFRVIFINGSTVDINESPFLFVIPFNSSVAQILIKQNQTIKDQVNVSQNLPSVNITFPIGGESFSNKFNVSWNATDADNDNLSFAILFSSDNGSTFSSLIVDYNKTLIEIDSANLTDCKNTCKVIVIATDGVLTANSTSKTFTLDNNLNITSFRVVYSNQTQRIFEVKVNNTAYYNISDISWSLDTGNGIKTSTIPFNLKPSEQIFIYIYHNYTLLGNFNLTATITRDVFTEIEIITVNI